MTLDTATLAALLRKNNSSLTKPRKAVFNLLLSKEPQSMQVLVKRAEGKVDRATVYRTIELFEELGIVHRLNIGWKYKIELIRHIFRPPPSFPLQQLRKDIYFSPPIPCLKQ
jgi:Fe2+ or Zn2+ uptake regulation protein